MIAAWCSAPPARAQPPGAMPSMDHSDVHGRTSAAGDRTSEAATMFPWQPATGESGRRAYTGEGRWPVRPQFDAGRRPTAVLRPARLLGRLHPRPVPAVAHGGRAEFRLAADWIGSKARARATTLHHLRTTGLVRRGLRSRGAQGRGRGGRRQTPRRTHRAALEPRRERLLEHATRRALRQRPQARPALVGVRRPGLAPYWFEIDATAYVGEKGRTALRFEAEIRSAADAEVDSATTRRGEFLRQDRHRARTRFRFVRCRARAPTVALRESGASSRRPSASNAATNTAAAPGFTRAEGQRTSELRLVAGLRFWF